MASGCCVGDFYAPQTGVADASVSHSEARISRLSGTGTVTPIRGGISETFGGVNFVTYTEYAPTFSTFVRTGYRQYAPYVRGMVEAQLTATQRVEIGLVQVPVGSAGTHALLALAFALAGVLVLRLRF